jgi:hypothetical protein
MHACVHLIKLFIETELKSILGHIKYILERKVVVNKRDNHKKAPINTYFQRKKKEFFQSSLGGACVNLIKLLTRITLCHIKNFHERKYLVNTQAN